METHADWKVKMNERKASASQRKEETDTVACESLSDDI